MKTIRIICRQSRLSLLQAELVKQKIRKVEPDAVIEIIGRSSRGDRELNIPLSSVDGTDFFTKEIFEALQHGEADFAVHSLKDMSAQHFFSHNAFAIVDRDDVRDVAIFNPEITRKIQAGETIIIGTCSPRREEMAISFLRKALPQLNQFKILVKAIRGNIEERLKQLHERKYDGTILATAGLNRLLRNEKETLPAVINPSGLVGDLLADKKLMLLPLFECVPAPCQGAIVAEAHPQNPEAVALLEKINVKELFDEALAEKKKAFEYGTGCLQKFGVTTIKTNDKSHLYAAGEDADGTTFSYWNNLPEWITDEKTSLFSSTDYMKDFFNYKWSDTMIDVDAPVMFIANYKAVQHSSFPALLLNGASPMQQQQGSTAGNIQLFLASGTKTWFALAKQGYWVSASADGLGFENLLPVLQMPLLKINANDICIITHATAAERWKQKGYKAVANYQLQPKNNEEIKKCVAGASFLFWSSFSQYEQFGLFAKHDATHMCAGGETASLLKQAGVKPVIFPTIKAFEQWRQTSIRSHSAA